MVRKNDPDGPSLGDFLVALFFAALWVVLIVSQLAGVGERLTRPVSMPPARIQLHVR